MSFFSQSLWPQSRTSHFGRTHSSTTTRSTTGSETAVPSGSICRPNCNRRYRSRSHLATAIRRAEIHSWTATSPSLPPHPHCRRSDPGTGSPAQVKPAQRHPATSCGFCTTDPSAHPNEHSSRRTPVFDFGCCRHFRQLCSSPSRTRPMPPHRPCVDLCAVTPAKAIGEPSGYGRESSAAFCAGVGSVRTRYTFRGVQPRREHRSSSAQGRLKLPSVHRRRKARYPKT